MRLTIFHKLFISLLLISTIMMVGMALLINKSFQSGLQNYLNQREIEQLEVISLQVGQYYSPIDGWKMIKEQPALWEELLRQIVDRPPNDDRSATEDRSPADKRRPPRRLNGDELAKLYNRIHLANAQGEPVIESVRVRKHEKTDPSFVEVPIVVENKTVGWISIMQKTSITSPLAESFFKEQLNNFYLIAVWVALFSFIGAGLLVQHFLKPLKSLHSGAKSLQQGDYEKTIVVQGNDELAELSRTFNSLADTLKQQKESRGQWLADISHELRTPIAVLLSEIEAIEDGIRKPEPKYIHSLHDQVTNLRLLVDDLYQLSLSDSGVHIDRSQLVDVKELLDVTADQYEVRLAEKNIQLTRIYEDSDEVMLKADAKSLTQLISNVFENSYRYTDANGLVQLSLLQNKNNIVLLIEDSAPAVPNESLAKLFQRLYRVDKSRSRAHGGSGLGLSICQNIVKAHGGEIVATHSSLGGLQIKITLPIKDI